MPTVEERTHIKQNAVSSKMIGGTSPHKRVKEVGPSSQDASDKFDFTNGTFSKTNEDEEEANQAELMTKKKGNMRR